MKKMLITYTLITPLLGMSIQSAVEQPSQKTEVKPEAPTKPPFLILTSTKSEPVNQPTVLNSLILNVIDKLKDAKTPEESFTILKELKDPTSDAAVNAVLNSKNALKHPILANFFDHKGFLGLWGTDAEALNPDLLQTALKTVHNTLMGLKVGKDTQTVETINIINDLLNHTINAKTQSLESKLDALKTSYNQLTKSGTISTLNITKGDTQKLADINTAINNLESIIKAVKSVINIGPVIPAVSQTGKEVGIGEFEKLQINTKKPIDVRPSQKPVELHVAPTPLEPTKENELKKLQPTETKKPVELPVAPTPLEPVKETELKKLQPTEAQQPVALQPQK